jgi:hypothetical protein
MANFKRKKMDGAMWGSQLGRAVFLASVNVSFSLISVIEIICYFIFHINIFYASHFEIFFVIGGILTSQLLGYIYINKKRYEYITSSQYNPFTRSIPSGVNIVFLLILASFIGSIGIALAINALLTK